MSKELETIARDLMVHQLKCHPGPFQAVKDGSKPFEWRKDDRDYRVGDALKLMEWDPRNNPSHFDLDCPYYPLGYTGEVEWRTVSYIIRGPAFGIPEGYCIMGLQQPPAGQVIKSGKDGDLITATMYINTMLAMFDNKGCVYPAQAMDAELRDEIIDWLSKLK